MRLILLGCPGAGKGTQANRLASKLGVVQIATGDILRRSVASGDEFGAKLGAIMDRGELISDALILEIVAKRLQEPDCAKGYILDGMPRTLAQAQGLMALNIPIDYVIDLAIEDKVICSRMAGRRVHLASGRSYHIEYNPPEVDGLDDLTGEPLVQREDDMADVVKKRLQVYHTQTSPLVAYFQGREHGKDGYVYHQVDATQNVADVSDAIVGIVGG